MEGTLSLSPVEAEAKNCSQKVVTTSLVTPVIYSPYFIVESERHFAGLIIMNFMIYNRNFAHQTSVLGKEEFGKP